MARLNYIHYESFDASLGEQGELVWREDGKRPIERLPQIVWADGRGWDEANVWALQRAASDEVDAATVKRGMKHLVRYADYLETHGIDWRHFPIRKDERVLNKFRKALMDAIKSGALAATTGVNCMNTVIQLYRFANVHNLVRPEAPMWSDRLVVIPFYDVAGFERAIVRVTTDLSIPNRQRVGAQLEDGLLPLREEHMTGLLAYTRGNAVEELHRMLTTGFFTGARIGTVTTLTVPSLETAREDPLTPGLYLLPVGPPTDVATKFSVPGDLKVPRAVLDDLKAYAFSANRLLREARARKEDKNWLFLTRRGRPYTVETVNRLVCDLRRKAVADGLKFMQDFTFHQSRATFGTWLMKILLDSGVRTTDAIAFVRDAMLHKDDETTLGYVTFLENTEGKQQAAAAFNQAFTGLQNRSWDRVYA